VVVTGDWPGGLVSLLCLDLPIAKAFFPSKFHGYFNSSNVQVTPWCSTLEFCGAADYKDGVIYVFLGSINFLWRTLPLIGGSQHVFVTVNVGHQGASRLVRVVKQGHKLCVD
jgi:hypothetical protein